MLVFADSAPMNIDRNLNSAGLLTHTHIEDQHAWKSKNTLLVLLRAVPPRSTSTETIRATSRKTPSPSAFGSTVRGDGLVL